MSDADAPETEVVASQHESARGLDLITTEAYHPPADGLLDMYRGADLALAKEVARMLASKFWGYPWSVTSNIAQGILAFQLPELMGPTLNVVIRVKDYYALDAKLILDEAGKLLERMNLPREQCDMDLYRAAKARLHTFDFDDVGKKRVHA